MVNLQVQERYLIPKFYVININQFDLLSYFILIIFSY
jgi:hypothetical protein